VEGTARLVQNMKAKVQATLQLGSWDAAWLLTGLADPLSRKKFAGTAQEMSVVSNYMSALAKLEKQVKEVKHHPLPAQVSEDDEGEEGEAPAWKKKKKNRGKKKKEEAKPPVV
jgi:hypothetical protein